LTFDSGQGSVQFISAQLATAWMTDNSDMTAVDVDKSVSMWAK